MPITTVTAVACAHCKKLHNKETDKYIEVTGKLQLTAVGTTVNWNDKSTKTATIDESVFCTLSCFQEYIQKELFADD